MKKETNISTKHNSRKNSNCREADQLAIYEHDRGTEPASTEKKFQLSGQSGQPWPGYIKSASAYSVS